MGSGVRHMKPSKAAYLAGGFLRYYLPAFGERRLSPADFTAAQIDEAERRIARYLHLPAGAKVDPASAIRVRDFRFPFGEEKKHSAYFFDLYPALRLNDPDKMFHHIFEDVNWEVGHPTLVKTRPIHRDATPSMGVICRLNSIRHFRWVDDPVPWVQKSDRLVFRNVVRQQPWRRTFVERAATSPLCDVGIINSDTELPEHITPFMSIDDQLGYKFIGCIEGNDVATNLKWVMSSNSIAVMPRPRIESWYLESDLRPGVHYIEIAHDYSDLDDKLNHYLTHPDEANAIIANARAYTMKFRDKKLERYIQQEVVRLYLATVQP